MQLTNTGARFISRDQWRAFMNAQRLSQPVTQYRLSRLLRIGENMFIRTTSTAGCELHHERHCPSQEGSRTAWRVQRRQLTEIHMTRGRAQRRQLTEIHMTRANISTNLQENVSLVIVADQLIN